MRLPYRHIVWDWNGTLLDDVPAAVNAINAMLRRRGLPATDMERYRELFGFPVRHYYAAVGFRLAGEDWDAVAREYHDRYLADTTVRLRPAAVPTLEFCRRAGLGLSILSASEQTILERMLADAGVTAHFDFIHGVDNLNGHSKADTGRRLLARLPCPARHVLFVGDTLHDHEVAAGLGCDCVLVAEGHQSRPRLLAAGCPVLDTLAEIPEHLRRLADPRGPRAPSRRGERHD
jgi:phosphoglycolate phosphatase